MQFQLPKTYFEISNLTHIYILAGKRSSAENIFQMLKITELEVGSHTEITAEPTKEVVCMHHASE